MRCEVARGLMDLSLDADLPRKNATAFYGHIHSCPRCADEYAQLGRLLREIRNYPVPVAPESFWKEVWHGVHQQIPAPSVQKKWWMQSRPRMATAAATMVAAAVALFLLSVGHHAPRGLALSEASSRHGMVLMSQPYSEPGLAMLAVSEGTLASYDNKDDE